MVLRLGLLTVGRVFQGLEWFCAQIVFLPALLGQIGALTALLEISMLKVRFSK